MSGRGAGFPEAVGEADARFMVAALSLGRRGLGRTAPNPSVGALVVRDGVIVGRGCTADGGRPHGEIVALGQAGEAARGATLYVTLEPCSHHGLTAPCCEAVAAAGVARVVYAVEDPNPLVAGRGAAYLRAHGIAVVAGVGALAARRDHRGHIRRMTVGRPAVTLKLAETLDGFVAGGPHDPRLAITGAAANGVVHVLRSTHDAVMVGIGTVAADDPLLTVRLPGLESRPLRIVVDGGFAIAPHSRLLLTADEAPILLVARADANGSAPPGIEVARVRSTATGGVDLAAALALLSERGLTRILSEGGPRLAEQLLAHDLVDEVMLFTAPRPLGREGVPGLGAVAREMLRTRFALLDDRAIGVDRLRHYSREDGCSPD